MYIIKRTQLCDVERLRVRKYDQFEYIMKWALAWQAASPRTISNERRDATLLFLKAPNKRGEGKFRIEFIYISSCKKLQVVS